jgi:tRNA(adenine34) deaminase
MSPESGFPLDASISAAMGAALSQAEAAGAVGEIPVGAVLLNEQGELVASAHNACRGDVVDVTAHAEMVVLRHASAMSRRGTLEGHTLVVTLEPCAMCAGAIAHARIDKLYYAADDPKGGAVDHGPALFSQPTVHHRPEVYGGIMATEAAGILREFFANRR